MFTADFSYHLPKALIAQDPAFPRDSSKLLVFERKSNTVEHCIFRDLSLFLGGSDVLVFNNTAVFPARLYGYISGKLCQVLLLKELRKIREFVYWSAMVKPGKHFKACGVFKISPGFEAKVESVVSDQDDFYGGNRILSFPRRNFFKNLETFGKVPFPPYIISSQAGFQNYQTVFAHEKGSVAAPTAGLHFTNELISELSKKNVQIEFVTLHIGVGTFKPVTSHKVESHVMHPEFYSLDKDVADRLNQAVHAGKRIIGVGTTSVRVLESCALISGQEFSIRPGAGETRLYIYPGYKWKVISGLITNFHLPRSTLLMLVCAFAGKKRVLGLYKKAVQRKYRFYSFGDAMMIL